ncbi:type 2 isopentenyl-diphosphate Delta-isomerase [Suttonella sp. R2A3]|uniref:type 2 isopentenyl-diphosphate Delta-isomerase n=1 Tax=Suttonella sp. R2A3 TaxID=2908648 RepID=UPI001F45FF2D|nr:type 2 isopentenyl-diphosphate Delta-isomerase [Suttonella sp. R2A3]UJF25418.1 type 2 isopentenyl-diphosphate Delta-isomerase [Suttonella sp. R2A3]
MSIAARKREHIAALARDAEIERHASGFDRLQFTHRALPQCALDDVDTRVDFLGKTLHFPLLISSMTGGDGETIRKVNQHLAEAAEACGVAMAVGSQRIMLSHPETSTSFDVRRYAPNTVLLANLGAVQLNTGFGIDEAQQAVDALKADGLYLHLNPLQEAVQPEGDTNFRALDRKIAALTGALDVPVLLKEVGCGLSPDDIALGKQAGVRYFDVAGRGGTSWSRIEHHRRSDPHDDIGLVFQDWGLTTVEALNLAHAAHPDVTLIASGGIRNGIDIAKAVALGAHVCGIAAPLLKPALHSTAAVIEAIERLAREYRTALFLLGCTHTDALRHQTHLLHSRDAS